MNISWMMLIIAGLSEVAFATCMNFSNGFTNVKWTIAFLLFSVFSFWSFSKAIENIPMGTAYVVWNGIGAVGAVLVGIFLFKENVSLMKIFFIATLIASVLGLEMMGENKNPSSKNDQALESNKYDSSIITSHIPQLAQNKLATSFSSLIKISKA